MCPPSAAFSAAFHLRETRRAQLVAQRKQQFQPELAGVKAKLKTLRATCEQMAPKMDTVAKRVKYDNIGAHSTCAGTAGTTVKHSKEERERRR